MVTDLKDLGGRSDSGPLAFGFEGAAGGSEQTAATAPYQGHYHRFPPYQLLPLSTSGAGLH